MTYELSPDITQSLWWANFVERFCQSGDKPSTMLAGPWQYQFIAHGPRYADRMFEAFKRAEQQLARDYALLPRGASR